MQKIECDDAALYRHFRNCSFEKIFFNFPNSASKLAYWVIVDILKYLMLSLADA